MALDDRDRNFEKALARQMRANAPEAFDCPDAETLAAYHDRMLSPEEMTAQKSHIAACPRCQETLATLEITEAIPVGAEENERAFAKDAARVLSAVHAAPVFSNPTQIPAADAKGSSIAQMPKPKPYLRWAVPAGAIAAGLLVWVAINHSWNAQKEARRSAPVEIAENRERKTPELSAREPADQTAAPSVEPKTKAVLKDEIRRKQQLDAGAAIEQDKALAPGRTNTRAYEHGPRIAQNQTQNLNQYQVQNGISNKDAELSKNNGILTVPPQVEPPPGNAPQLTQRQAKAPPPVEAPVPASADASAGRGAREDARTGQLTASVEVADAAKATVKAKTAAKEKKAADAETKMLRRLESVQSVGGMNAASLRDIKTSEENFIHTPDSGIFWFVAPSGEVFKTEDAGKTIHRQEIGAGIKALAGSSPDANVCWLVGQNGIVLRTADGGKHWVKIAAPQFVNFTSVSASDALHAALSDASGKVRYSTSDGGATWAAVLP
jgi:anti-sigma factor RsiW